MPKREAIKEASLNSQTRRSERREAKLLLLWPFGILLLGFLFAAIRTGILAKYLKVFIIVCPALLVIAPWILPRRRRGQLIGELGEDTAGSTGDGGGYGHHHGGHDGGDAGGYGAGHH